MLQNKPPNSMRNSKEDQNKWSTSCSWIGRLNIAKMSTVSKLFYRVNAILIKIPTFFFFCGA